MYTSLKYCRTTIITHVYFSTIFSFLLMMKAILKLQPKSATLSYSVQVSSTDIAAGSCVCVYYIWKCGGKGRNHRGLFKVREYLFPNLEADCRCINTVKWDRIGPSISKVLAGENWTCLMFSFHSLSPSFSLSSWGNCSQETAAVLKGINL